MKDMVVIGSGPAGISAAIYAKRAGIDVTVIGKDGGTLETLKKIENYYGFEEPISGRGIYEKGIAQAKRLGIEVIFDEVVDVQMDVDGYLIGTVNEKPIQTKVVVIATGAPRIGLQVPGVKEYEGKGVSYCATCDGFFFRGKDVVVVGRDKFARSEAVYLKNLVNSITMISDEDVAEILGDGKKVTAVKTKEGKEIKIDGVFIAIGSASSIALAKKIGIETANNKIVIDEHCKTSAPGVFACGDCTPGLMQIARSVYEGMIVGNNVAEYLLGQ